VMWRITKNSDRELLIVFATAFTLHTPLPLDTAYAPPRCFT